MRLFIEIFKKKCLLFQCTFFFLTDQFNFIVRVCNYIDCIIFEQMSMYENVLSILYVLFEIMFILKFCFHANW